MTTNFSTEKYCQHCLHCNPSVWTESKILEEGPKFIRAQCDIMTKIFNDKNDVDYFPSDRKNLIARVSRVQEKIKNLGHELDHIRESGSNYNSELDKIRSLCFNILLHIQTFNENAQSDNECDKWVNRLAMSAGVVFWVSAAVFALHSASYVFNGPTNPSLGYSSAISATATFTVAYMFGSCINTADGITRSNKLFIDTLQNIIRDFESENSKAALSNVVTQIIPISK